MRIGAVEQTSRIQGGGCLSVSNLEVSTCRVVGVFEVEIEYGAAGLQVQYSTRTEYEYRIHTSTVVPMHPMHHQPDTRRTREISEGGFLGVGVAEHLEAPRTSARG
jgi:hypothetical protein